MSEPRTAEAAKHGEPSAMVAPRPREEHIYIDERDTIVVANDKLSEHQKQVAEELQLLYRSLCGRIPGQPWPQALLDSAGRFDRPPFPRRGRT